MKFLHIVSGLFLFAFSSLLMAECPAYLQGEYRKLHSTDDVDMCALTKDKVVLVINTASHCGFTSQFKGLEALYEKYKDRGLVLVGFTSDDFNQEAKEEAEAADICFINYGVTFTMLAPSHVKGDDANKVFAALAKETTAPSWNFNKYLIDKNGKIISHFGSKVKPDDKSLSSAIEKLL